MSAQPLDNIGIFFGFESFVGDFGGGKGRSHRRSGFRVQGYFIVKLAGSKIPFRIIKSDFWETA
jgi:hypothetical protein